MLYVWPLIIKASNCDQKSALLIEKEWRSWKASERGPAWMRQQTRNVWRMEKMNHVWGAIPYGSSSRTLHQRPAQCQSKAKHWFSCQCNGHTPRFSLSCLHYCIALWAPRSFHDWAGAAPVRCLTAGEFTVHFHIYDFGNYSSPLQNN